MARLRVRYLVVRPGAAGELPRYFWQPSSELRAAGWKPVRVPDNWRDLADAAALEAAAWRAAQARNGEIDLWRSGAAPTSGSSPAAPAPAAEARSVAALIALYRASPRWAGLAPKTRLEYGKCLGVIADWAGDAPVRAMQPVRFVKWYEQHQPKTPAKANAVMRVAQLLFGYCRRLGWRDDNPASKLGLIATPPSGLVWPAAAVDAFVAAADAQGRHSIGTAILVNEWLGQREADVLRLPRDLLARRGFILRQRKTGAGVPLPVAMVPQLAARITAEIEHQRARGVVSTRLIVSEETGEPYQPDNFRHCFAAVRAVVAATTPRFAVDYLPPGAAAEGADAFTVRTADLWFMHLRHTAITRLADAGCTTEQITAITGHTLESAEQILERYRVRTGSQAIAAFQKRLDAEGGR